MTIAKYTSDEILQILVDFYNYQAAFDVEGVSGEQPSFEVTISDWRAICAFSNPKVLAKNIHDIFKLATPLSELENILVDQNKTLRIVCTYISEHATKQMVSPIVMMGKSCITAAIYKTLIFNLKEQGVKTAGLQPSSKLAPLFKKYGYILISEVNKLAPGSFTKFEYQENWISKTGISLNMFFLVSIVVVSLAWHFHWALFISLALGLSFMFIGGKFKPKKEVIGGYDTMRDLILGMESQMRKSV